MSRREYKGQALVVSFDLKRCIHSARCLRALPGVFDVDARPWIQPDKASADDVARAVAGCPSGALQYRRLDGGAEEEIPEPTRLIALKNGPILVNGKMELVAHDGTPIECGPRATLCRCGHSANKPFCDNSHRAAGFQTE